MERYRVGQVMPLREKGEHFANARVVRRFTPILPILLMPII
jgi:hypothetical protein